MGASAVAAGVSRPHLSATLHAGPRRGRGRPPQPDGELVAAIGDLPAYVYRRVHALLRRQAEATGRAAPNPVGVYRVMKLHGLHLQHAGRRDQQRRHKGRVAVDIRNTRWRPDGLETACDNGEKARVAFARECCDRAAISYVATMARISAGDVRDLMTLSVAHRFAKSTRGQIPSSG